jgi:hypothetical protein
MRQKPESDIFEESIQGRLHGLYCPKNVPGIT